VVIHRQVRPGLLQGTSREKPVAFFRTRDTPNAIGLWSTLVKFQRTRGVLRLMRRDPQPVGEGRSQPSDPTLEHSHR
jgi:hypothetical protein